MEFPHFFIYILMTASYLTCGSIFLLALAHFSNASRANAAANAWLGLFFFCVGTTLMAFIAEHTSLSVQYPLLVPFTESIRFAMAPSLYLGILYFTSIRRTWRRTDYFHFLPLVLFLPVLCFGNPHLPRFFGMFMGISIKLQMAIYWILSFRVLRRHQRMTATLTAAPQTIDLKWLQYLLIGIAAMMLLWYNQVFKINGYIERFTGIGYLLAVYTIAFFSLRQREIFPYNETGKTVLLEAVEKKKGTPRLTTAAMQQLKSQLETLIETERVFTESDLNLPRLARKMNIPVHELSYLLNNGYGENFYQYINRHRVHRARELLHSEKHQHLSMLGIAFEAGFNSKTTFNNAFRKTTGMSPSEFRELPVRMDTTGH